MSTGTAAPSVVRIWLMAARPKTLPVGLAPVLVGTALADTAGVFHPLRFVAALLGALFIQVGANLSNDYSDARRGADTEDRLGPVRVTAGGLVPPRQVLIATYVDVRARDPLRRLPDRRRRLAAAARRRRLDRRGRALHRRAAAVRLRGPRRAVRVPLLRDRRGRRLVLRADRDARVGGVRAGGAGRAARLRGARRQQRARPRDRQTRRQAHAGRAARARAHARRCSRRWSTAPSCSRRSPGSSARSSPGCCCPSWRCRWRRRSCATVRDAHRRPVAQRGACAHRPARAGLLRAAVAPASC